MRPLTFVRFYALSAILGACGLWVVACASNSIGTVGPNRSGVIRERFTGGTLPADLGAQDAPSRLRNEQPTTGESLAAKAGSPGFASESRVSMRSDRSAHSATKPSADDSAESLVARSRGVRHVPAPESTLLELERNPVPGSYLRTLAADAASLCGVPPALFAALVERESSWRQYDRHGAVLRSSSGALGLAQVKPSTGREVSPSLDIRSAWGNLVAGACYLRRQFDRFGSWERALMAYRVGPSGLATREARAYVADIVTGSAQ